MRGACAAAACLIAAPKAAQAFVNSGVATLPRTAVLGASTSTTRARHPRAVILSKNPIQPQVASLRMSSSLLPNSNTGHGEGRQASTSVLLAAASSTFESSSSNLTGGTADKSSDTSMVLSKEKSKLFKVYEKGAEYFTNLFPVWLTIFSLVALKDPTMFEWFTTE